MPGQDIVIDDDDVGLREGPVDDPILRGVVSHLVSLRSQLILSDAGQTIRTRLIAGPGVKQADDLDRLAEAHPSASRALCRWRRRLMPAN